MNKMIIIKEELKNLYKQQNELYTNTHIYRKQADLVNFVLPVYTDLEQIQRYEYLKKVDELREQIKNKKSEYTKELVKARAKHKDGAIFFDIEAFKRKSLKGVSSEMWFGDTETTPAGSYISETYNKSNAAVNCVGLTKINTAYVEDEGYKLVDAQNVQQFSCAYLDNNKCIQAMFDILFEQVNRKATIYFHNFINFDGIFIRNWLLNSDWTYYNEYMEDKLYLNKDETNYVYEINDSNGYMSIKVFRLIWDNKKYEILKEEYERKVKVANEVQAKKLTSTFNRQVGYCWQVKELMFVDSWRLFPISVKKIGEAVEFNKGQTMEETTILRSKVDSDEALQKNATLIPYCLRDTLIVAKFFMMVFDDLFVSANKNMPLTAGGVAMKHLFNLLKPYFADKEFTDKYGKKKKGLTTENFSFLVWHLSKKEVRDVNDFFHTFYSGGLTSYNINYLRQLLNGCGLIDVNSQYPDKMRNSKIGIGSVRVAPGREYNKFVEKAMNWTEPAFVVAVFHNIKQTDKCFNFLSNSNVLDNELFIKVFGQSIYNYISDTELREWASKEEDREIQFTAYSTFKDKYYFTGTIYEFEQIKKLVKYDYCDIKMVFYWEEYISVYKDLIDDYSVKKQIAKQNGETAKEKTMKLLQNSAYGKTVQKVIQETSVMAGYEVRDGLNIKSCEEGKDTILEIESENWFAYAPAGCIITSLSRGYLLEMAALLIDKGYTVIYCDTDSIIYLRNGHKPEDIYLVDGVTKDKKLGKWDVESLDFDCYIALRKKYVCWSGGKIIKMALAGINKNKAMEQIDELFVDEKLAVENKNGLLAILDSLHYNIPLMTLEKREDEYGITLQETLKSPYAKETFANIQIWEKK